MPPPAEGGPPGEVSPEGLPPTPKPGGPRMYVRTPPASGGSSPERNRNSGG